MLPADARAALEASTKWMIAERDSLHACISDVEGNIPDDDDGDYLRGLDKLIDANQAVLAKYPEGEDPCEELLEAVKRLARAALRMRRDPNGLKQTTMEWYRLQAATAKVDQIYDGGGAQC